MLFALTGVMFLTDSNLTSIAAANLSWQSMTSIGLKSTPFHLFTMTTQTVSGLSEEFRWSNSLVVHASL